MPNPILALSFLGASLPNITPDEVVAWGTALSTSVVTVLAAIEFGGRRILRAWTDEYGKLKASERAMHEELKKSHEELRASYDRLDQDFQAIREDLYHQIDALRVDREIWKKKAEDLTEKLRKFRCPLAAGGEPRCLDGCEAAGAPSGDPPADEI